jgi:hypothetical protein
LARLFAVLSHNLVGLGVLAAWWPLPARQSPDAREECWHVYYGDVRASVIAVRKYAIMNCSQANKTGSRMLRPCCMERLGGLGKPLISFALVCNPLQHEIGQ